MATSTLEERTASIEAAFEQHSGKAKYISAIGDSVDITLAFVDKVEEKGKTTELLELKIAPRPSVRRNAIHKWREKLEHNRVEAIANSEQRARNARDGIGDSTYSATISVKAGGVALLVWELFDGDCDAQSLGLPQETCTKIAPLLRKYLPFPKSQLFPRSKDVSWCESQIRSVCWDDGFQPLWEAALIIRKWSLHVEKTAATSGDFRFLEHSIHKQRLLQWAIQLTADPVLTKPLDPFCYFLLYAAIQLHDLGFFLGHDLFYPDLNGRQCDAEDRYWIYERHHQIIGRVLSDFSRGRLPEFIRREVSTIEQRSPRGSSEVVQVLSEAAPLLRFLVDNHNVDTRKRLVTTKAAHVINEIHGRARQIPNIGDLVYLLAVLRLTDSLDRSRRRLLDDSQISSIVEEARSESGVSPLDWQYRAFRILECGYINNSDLVVDHKAETIELKLSLRSESWLPRTDDRFGRAFLRELRGRFDADENPLVQEFSNRVRYSYLGVKLSPADQLDLKPVPRTVVRALGIDEEEKPRGSVSRIIRETMSFLPRYNTWLKLCHPWRLLWGGDASVLDRPGWQGLFRRMVYHLDDWGWPDMCTPLEIDNVRLMFDRIPAGGKKFITASMRMSEGVDCEVYVPVHAHGQKVAVANIHFSGNHVNQAEWPDILHHYATNLAYDLSDIGTELSKHRRAQVDVAADHLYEIWARQHHDTSTDEPTIRVIGDALNGCLLKETADLKAIVAAVLDENPRIRPSVVLNPKQPLQRELIDTRPLPFLTPSTQAFTRMLSRLFADLAPYGEFLVEYGFIVHMPLVYLRITSSSKHIDKALRQPEVALDFENSDIFPDLVEWSNHELGCLCEARLLAALSCGQIRFGTCDQLNPSCRYTTDTPAEIPIAIQIELPIPALDRARWF